MRIVVHIILFVVMSLVGAIFGAGQSSAQLDTCFWPTKQRAAQIVVQIEHTKVSAPDDRGYCQLTGIVARSFRGDVPVGTEITASFACDQDGSIVGTYLDDVVAESPAVQLHMDTDFEILPGGAGMFFLSSLTDGVVTMTVSDCMTLGLY